MSFNLFGFDCSKCLGIYGLWIASVTNDAGAGRSLVSVEYAEGSLSIDILWCRVI